MASSIVPPYDRLAEVKAFDETKAGVKGLVDAGIREIPRMFMHPPEILNPKAPAAVNCLEIIPTIDLGSTNRSSTVEKIRRASEDIGIFYVTNHGIPMSVMEEMLNGVRRFHEQDVEVKKKFYTRDASKAVVYNSNFDLYFSSVAGWRDTFASIMAPTPPPYEELPEVCRDIMMEYSNELKKLGVVIFRLISEALGLDPDYLGDMDCDKGFRLLCNYYPACPQPDLTMGVAPHTDPNFLTVLLQGEIGGLQILHQDQWVDVTPVPGSLVVNIGDLLQLLSNDKLKSLEHRAVAKEKGPRVSVACFFRSLETSRTYGPLKDFVSSDNPPRYRETTIEEYYFQHSLGKPIDDNIHRLQRLKL
uniref:1-aminocyclopropane-1-carboxylate oxidase homolog 1-like n=1 Tax=Erigeron canadensis TaxID=72917 RepID=UPI001CB8DFA8|nr:1-aminocyclopropane-1-carboxylate oxidase homolog 1-like [Erigeron canadensis]